MRGRGAVALAASDAAGDRGGFRVNYERKVDVMDSLAGSTQSYYEEADSRRKRTWLIVAVVLIALALAATWYAFTSNKDGAAGERDSAIELAGRSG